MSISAVSQSDLLRVAEEELGVLIEERGRLLYNSIHTLKIDSIYVGGLNLGGEENTPQLREAFQTRDQG